MRIEEAELCLEGSRTRDELMRDGGREEEWAFQVRVCLMKINILDRF